MNTLEEYLKCHLYYFSLGYAAYIYIYKSYMIWSAQLYYYLGKHVSHISGLIKFIFTKNKFRIPDKTLTLKTYWFWLCFSNLYISLLSFWQKTLTAWENTTDNLKVKFKVIIYIFFQCIYINEFNCIKNHNLSLKVVFLIKTFHFLFINSQGKAAGLN